VSVLRTWILPVIRIVILLVIAAALVKIAFFADPAPTGAPQFPSGEIVEPQIPVTVGTIQNDVTVQGTVTADAAVPVKATLAGDVVKLLADRGQAVAADTPVLTIRQETPGAFRDDGTMARNTVKTVTVLAGSPGVLSALVVIAGQTVTVGEVVAQVAPTTFNVSGALAPEQQYRLLVRPADARVTIAGGPAPFTCTGLTISSVLAGAGDAGSGGADGGAPLSGATVRCAVPAAVTVFSGLSATLSLAGGIAENVMTVPVTAVEGTAGSGNVYVPLAGGGTEVKAVVLGLNDGVNVEVKEGLAEGDMIMQFVPGAQQPGIDLGDGCTEFPDGTVECAG
jgi:macrolide-specific efflux system membrane fusion protein